MSQRDAGFLIGLLMLGVGSGWNRPDVGMIVCGGVLVCSAIVAQVLSAVKK